MFARFKRLNDMANGIFSEECDHRVRDGRQGGDFCGVSETRTRASHGFIAELLFYLRTSYT